jgi:hypothetical protein
MYTSFTTSLFATAPYLNRCVWVPDREDAFHSGTQHLRWSCAVSPSTHNVISRNLLSQSEAHPPCLWLWSCWGILSVPDVAHASNFLTHRLIALARLGHFSEATFFVFFCRVNCGFHILVCHARNTCLYAPTLLHHIQMWWITTCPSSSRTKLSNSVRFQKSPSSLSSHKLHTPKWCTLLNWSPQITSVPIGPVLASSPCRSAWTPVKMVSIRINSFL